ncbi:hypothetical protein LOTGIDRAFT_117139, partial [Lottia gigantea]
LQCPLCMELLEIDDINFYPCTCGYQICRFCWHRIRTDENGLCPACRKQYPEDPAEFKPLTEDILLKIKRERRQKDVQKKQKAAENRKHLANVRVVQKNLVFVVGLSQRIAESEVLKKHEYFGKFGKIHKVVINQSTSYAGSQASGPSASGYVTYYKSEDALKAIMHVNNIHVDGRTLKASLGTTKYCSHFLKGTQCLKSDCMYLHELGEEAASFTKEEMQMGKHQEYEQKLIENFLNSQNSANNHLSSNNKIKTGRKKSTSPINDQPPDNQQQTNRTESNQTPPQSSEITHGQPSPVSGSNTDTWPTLAGNNGKIERLTNGNRQSTNSPDIRSETPPTNNTNKAFSDNIPVSSETDWQAAFGFHSSKEKDLDDDLGFDPCNESFKGLADLIEKENGLNRQHAVNMQQRQFGYGQNPMTSMTQQPSAPQTQQQRPHFNNIPPGFSLSHIQQHQQQQLLKQPYYRPGKFKTKIMLV